MTYLWVALALASNDPARNTLSLPVAPLLAGGVSLQAERSTDTLDWSFAASVGARSSASGDYRGFNLSLGLEARRWWHVGPLASSSRFGTVGGVFSWARADAVWVRLESRDAVVGASVRPSLSLGVGYRLLPVWRLEITPLIGAAFDVEALRLTASFGLTVGLVF